MKKFTIMLDEDEITPFENVLSCALQAVELETPERQVTRRILRRLNAAQVTRERDET